MARCSPHPPRTPRHTPLAEPTHRVAHYSGRMLAAYAHAQSDTNPLDCLTVGDLPDPTPTPGWVRVAVNAAALNHHDLWSLRGVGLPADRLPMILGCDAAGTTDDGTEVLVHSVIASDTWRGDETLDPARSLLSEKHPGTLAEYVTVPAANIIPKHPDITWAEAACLSTAWLTAYRMLFVTGDVKPGHTVLVQGVGGGVASALIALASAAGIRVWATSRDPERGQRALALGADQVFASGERLPSRVDAVMETVGQATWAHSLKSLRPGGVVVVCGATSGATPSADLNRVFFLQLQVRGSTMGTAAELADLQQFCVTTGVRPTIDRVLPLTHARDGLAALADGSMFGKIVLTP